MSARLALESDALLVSINSDVGGTLTEIRHKASGLSVLGRAPWTSIATPLESLGAPDEKTWLTRFTGGWPPLFPNAGDACHFAGVFHGFHGEASISPWSIESAGDSVRLKRLFSTVPVRMERSIGLDHDVVIVHETIAMEGREPIEVMWGQHPTFGTDLLDGDFEIATSAQTVAVDTLYDPPANPLLPGAVAAWPIVPGRAGPYDLRRPGQGDEPHAVAALSYLRDFDTAWVGIRRLDDAIAVALTWDAAVFPCAWFWIELQGTADAPWDGRARLIGLEPNTTCSGYGLADAARRGENLLTLTPGTSIGATFRLQVFKPEGRLTGVGPDGRVTYG